MTSVHRAIGLAGLACTAFAGLSPSRAAEPPAPASCEPHKGLSFVCGPASVEDLVPLEGTPWLIGSGLAEGNVAGRLHLIDTRGKRWQVGWPQPAGARGAPDKAAFADCASMPDVEKFSAHGLSVRRVSSGHYRLVAVNHGGREAVEFFDVDATQATPAITWKGCVRMPADAYVNSVVLLPNGGLLATKFYAQGGNGIAAIQTGNVTGGVLEWSPGAAVREIPGTGLNGANGIEQSEDGKVIYVAEWGKRRVVRFDRHGAQLKTDAVSLDFNPDNLRWGPNGVLLAAGQRLGRNGNGPGFALDGWEVATLTPATLAVSPLWSGDKTHVMQGVSVGVIVDGTLWVGPFRGDRIGYVAVGR